MNRIPLFLAALVCLGLCAPAASAQGRLEHYTIAGDMAYQAGELEEAEADWQQALKLAESGAVPESRLCSVLRRLGLVLYMEGKFPEGEKVFRRVLAIDESMFGQDSIEIVEDMNNLIRCLRRQRHYQQAEPFIQRALDIRRRKLGQDDRMTANSWLDLAVNYDRQGKLQEAEPGYLAALAIRRKVFGEDHYVMIPVLQGYSSLLRRLNRDAEAAALELRLAGVRRKNAQEGGNASAQMGQGGDTPAVSGAAGSAAAGLSGQPATFANPAIPASLPSNAGFSLNGD